MKIDIRNEEGVAILALIGKLTIGEGDVMLREEIESQLGSGVKKLLLDMQGVKTMDSSGLGELIRCKASANREGAVIKLLHVEAKVQQVLEMTHLIGVFDSYAEETDAMASFRD